MLEQIWKNVAGTLLPYSFKEGEIKVEVTKGSDVRLYEFTRAFLLLKNELGKGIEVKADMEIEEEVEKVYFKISVKEEQKKRMTKKPTEEKEE